MGYITATMNSAFSKLHIGRRLKTHSVAVLLAIAAGALIGGPHVWFILSAGDQYQGIQMFGADAETNYLTRIQEAAEGGDAANPYLFEEKGTLPSSYEILGERILAIPTVLFGIPVATMNLWYKFFLPAIAFMLAYGLAFRVTRRRSAGIIAASLGILGLQLFSVADLKYFLGMAGPAYEVFTNFANYGRPVNPEFSGILFFVYLNLLWSFWTLGGMDWEHVWKRKLAVILGLAACYAASFYVYFYTWTFFTVLNGLFFLGLLALRRVRDAVHIAFLTALGFLAAIPYILNLIAFTYHPYYRDISKTFGFIFTHAPRASTAGIATTFTLIATVLLERFAPARTHARDEKHTALFLALLLGTAFIVINQQVITGRLLQEGHYHWYFNTAIFGLILAWAATTIGRRMTFKWFMPIIAAIVALLAFATTLQIQRASYLAQKEAALADQPYAPLFDWLNENAEPEEVVLADRRLSEWTTVYTHQNAFWSEYNFTYLVPRVRFMYTLFLYLTLHDIPASAMPEAAFHPPAHGADEAAYNQPNTRGLVGNRREYLIGFYPDGMAELYQYYLASPFEDRLKDYRIDYIAVDLRHDQTWLAHIPKSAQKVFEHGPILLYKLNP